MNVGVLALPEDGRVVVVYEKSAQFVVWVKRTGYLDGLEQVKVQ